MAINTDGDVREINEIPKQNRKEITQEFDNVELLANNKR
jgi:hypothetical protein